MSIAPFFHVYHKYVFIMANISKIKISGTSYNLKDENACKVVELTQAQYDELPTTAKTSNSLFVITDATAGDLSNYYTKSETSGATEISTALNAKADTATTYTKTETDNAITAATSTKQDTLVSGTNIKTINNQSILGEGNITIQGGGGKAIEAGKNISITTGETADTINCTLPIKTNAWNSLTFNSSQEPSKVLYASSFGDYTTASGKASFSIGKDTTASGNYSFVGGKNKSKAIGEASFAFGDEVIVNSQTSAAFGRYITTKNLYEFGCGTLNNSLNGSSSDSGNTLFSVGNGKYGERHNAFEIRQNGDIYISDTNDTSTTNYYEKPMIKLQDALGGGGGSITIDPSLDSGSTNAVANSAITNAIYNQTARFDGYASDGYLVRLSSREDGNAISISGMKIKTLANVISQNSSGTWLYTSTINGKKALSNSSSNTKDFSLVETSAITTTITSASTDSQVPSAKAVNDQLGGLKLVKLTQSEYDSLTTKDNSTLYVIVN